MSQQYRRELGALADTYRTALISPIESLARALSETAGRPLRTVGSGGAFTSAVLCARLHELYTNSIGKAVTPLDLLGSPPVDDAGVMCLSASGRNRDICDAFEAAALGEARPLLAMCLASGSALKALETRYTYGHVVELDLPILADGFLAVNSLFAMAILLTRAYRLIADERVSLPSRLEDLLANGVWPDLLSDGRQTWNSVLTRDTGIVLFSPSLSASAADLESRFAEGALGKLYTSDWRNFGHGRHHWLAKRSSSTGVIALVGEGDKELAARTLALLPESTSRVVASFSGREDEQTLCSLFLSLHIAEVAGSLVGIDPGKPGVPEFGRKLYHLAPRLQRCPVQEEVREVSIRRKALARAIRHGEADRERVHLAYDHFCHRLRQAPAAAIVLDYDGTLCDRRRRLDPIEPKVASRLSELLAEGAHIGVATGRGRSAGQALRQSISEKYWARIYVGYYNGSVVAPLSAVEVPADIEPGSTAKAIAESLEREGLGGSTVEARRSQVTLTLVQGVRSERLVRRVTELVRLLDPRATVVCSSHAIDVVLEGATKLSVVDVIRRAVGVDATAPVLRLGDKGCWPGNDYVLLADPYGLSVDEVSEDLEFCWNLSPPGVLGLQATLYYLSLLTVGKSGHLWLSLP